ncbi:MAG: hypothetical protein HYS04_19905, partial [Acidobacteria bacterium]|nr:hypothetical protein [Acidobacteriota bacterium]
MLKRANTSDRLLKPDGLETAKVNACVKPLLPDGEKETTDGAVSTQAWKVVPAVPAVA